MQLTKEFISLTDLIKNHLPFEQRDNPVVYRSKKVLAQENPTLIELIGERTNCTGYVGCCACDHSDCMDH